MNNRLDYVSCSISFGARMKNTNLMVSIKVRLLDH